MTAENWTLTIQTVVFHNEFEALLRAFKAAAHAASRAQSIALLSSWAIAWGDCSSSPTLTAEQLTELESIAGELGGDFTYTFFDSNLGSAAGHNRLAERSNDDFLLILNPDAEVSPTCIAILLETIQPGVGSVEARQLPLEHPKDYDASTLETVWSSTACLLTRRGTFREVGGFDEKTFFLYCDDVDYSWQLQLAGFRVLYQPAATVFHDKRLSVRGEWLATPSEEYYSAEAALLLAHKYSRPDLVKSLSKAFKSGSVEQKEALGEFSRRQQSGSLVTPVDSNHQVAQFVEGNYAKHRF